MYMVIEKLQAELRDLEHLKQFTATLGMGVPDCHLQRGQTGCGLLEGTDEG